MSKFITNIIEYHPTCCGGVGGGAPQPGGPDHDVVPELHVVPAEPRQSRDSLSANHSSPDQPRQLRRVVPRRAQPPAQRRALPGRGGVAANSHYLDRATLSLSSFYFKSF